MSYNFGTQTNFKFLVKVCGCQQRMLFTMEQCMKSSFKFSLFFFLLFYSLLNGREEVNLSFSNLDKVGMDAEAKVS
jgi:hypothetical protein